MEKENIVALCDVDWIKAAKTFAKHPDVPRYKDFRIMLEKQKDIDAVTVGTPDHFHAVAAMAAIQMGKHVFVEKPLTHNIYEARMLMKAAREAKVATQMGNQGHAMESIRLLGEWIWDGAIGPVTEVQAWTPHPVWPQGMDRPAKV
jgi:predicted dehydrogenase